MSTKKPRLWNPKPHKAVDWNQKAIEKALQQGSLEACVKYDGFRCLITHIDGELRITTREGIELTSLDAFRPKFGSLLSEHDALCLDAEVCILGVPFEDASGLLRRDAPLTGEQLCKVRFVVFDCVRRQHMQADTTDAGCRRHRVHWLHRYLPEDRLEHRNTGGIYLEAPWFVYSIEDIAHCYKVVRARGEEGMILKSSWLDYRNGKVTGWWKVKPGCGADFAPGFEADGVVVGYVWGDEGKANAGKIVGFRVKLEDGSEVNATGLTQAQMQHYTSNYHATAYEVGINRTIYIGQHCRVSGMERTKDGSIRHPHFDGFRDIGGTKA